MANMAEYTGWIKPDGSWLHLEYGCHLTAAFAAGENDPEGAGWVHVSWGLVTPVASITVEQRATLVRLAKECKADLFWLDDCEVK